MKKVLFIVANSWFQDMEFQIPFDYLKNNWLSVDIAAERSWECIWIFGKRIEANIAIDNIDTNYYEMVIFIWWGWAYSQYFWNKGYLNLAQKSKKIWAICITPMILSDCGIFNWVKVTGRNQNNVQKNFIIKNWGIFLEQDVVVCWNIVTANWPSAAQEFAKRCFELISD